PGHIDLEAGGGCGRDVGRRSGRDRERGGGGWRRRRPRYATVGRRGEDLVRVERVRGQVDDDARGTWRQHRAGEREWAASLRLQDEVLERPRNGGPRHRDLGV